MLKSVVTRIGPVVFLVLGVVTGILWARAAAEAGPRPVSPVTMAEGQQLYAIDCATCHGPAGDGAGGAPRLDTGLASFSTEAALASFIRRNMPATAPGTLTPHQARAVATYLWTLNHPSPR
ncbi:MAG: cytochrome c [Actinomycetia bacterium]|nr:cytochrome c [Actinomycetes bacterium]